MYDNIRIKVANPSGFATSDIEKLIERFSMSNKNLSTGCYNNAGNTGLIQNRGVYVSYIPPSGLGGEHIILQFSLHKYWNCVNSGKLENHNLFTRSNSLEAFENMCAWFPIDIEGSKVLNYEAGVNIPVLENPKKYLVHLSHIVRGKTNIRLIESPKFKEYSLYSSHSYDLKRAVFVGYDKTQESNLSENIVRFEKKYMRLSSPVNYSSLDNGLFSSEFLQYTKNDIESCFLNNMRYKTHVVHEKGLTKSVLEVYNILNTFGSSWENELLERYKNEEMTKTNYYRLKKRIIEFLSSGCDYSSKVRSEADFLSKKIAEIIAKI